MSTARFSIREALEGRRVFLLGGTGFVGKVLVSMVLDRFPEVGRIHLMVRSSGEPEERFWRDVVPSPAFDPLRERHGAGLERFLREKVHVVGGDIAEEHLGLGEEGAARLAAEVDVVVNSTGLVVFDPPLDAALKTNVAGTRNVLDFARRMARPAVVHVSTCYVVTGHRSGQFGEEAPVIGGCPRSENTPAFDLAAEVRAAQRAVAMAREEADDPSLLAGFREAARERLRREARDARDERTMAGAMAMERKAWLRRRLTEVGAERAQRWGWPNVYTYTKSLGEQMVTAEPDMVRCIARPSIVESAEWYPFPGWNEGFNTTAPVLRLAAKGLSHFPLKEEVALDIIPVDSAAAGILAVSAQACVETPALVHQLCSSDLNPLPLARINGLVELDRRGPLSEGEGVRGLVNGLLARTRVRGVDPDLFERALPALKTAVRTASSLLHGLAGQRLGMGNWARQARAGLSSVDDLLALAQDQTRTFRPFMADQSYAFRADNTRALFARLPEDERERLRWSPETIDWYRYWLEVHLPGLKRWVYPSLEAGEGARVRSTPRYRTLLELFAGATSAHAPRTAMRMQRDGQDERYTYADLRECVLRAAAFLARQGVRPGDHVALLSENSPEWGMSYFGILRAGAACVPIARDASTAEVARLLKLSDARALLLSEAQAAQHRGLAVALEHAGSGAEVFRFDEVFELREEAEEKADIARLPASVTPDAVASILFTSGTTGQPKGVMLTHRNFTSQVSQLLSVYDFDHDDGMLSVLPLHHSFEFTTGFLLPLSRGASITYLQELSGDAISRTLQTGHVTCVVGVPALWDLMKTRVMERLAGRSRRRREVVDRLIDLSLRLRQEQGVNLGPLLFMPVHRGFGGRLRHLISGGAALGKDTLRVFRGLGFDLNEGYGLTEAAPVLTVTRPGDRASAGSVGSPLPGVELRILDPQEDGVGEVAARAPGVMAGYYKDEGATRQAVREGWLLTGDLGRLDADGRLHLVGRLKDLIIGADGKNVHPDELESLYFSPAVIKEMCVVGIGDGQGTDRIACLAVPAYERHPGLGRTEVRGLVEEHFRGVSAALPAHKRVRVLELWDGELPRTATRKPKRREVAALLERMRDERGGSGRERGSAVEAGGNGAAASLAWTIDLVARVSGRPRREIQPGASLEELGFDSLTYAELEAALEDEGLALPEGESASAFRDLRELTRALRRSDGRAAALAHDAPANGNGDLRLPSIVSGLGRRALTLAQGLFYGRVLDTEIAGQSHLPARGPFIVAANHASHLDAGLVRTALGRSGDGLAILAAADYFFDTRLKRLVFSNFTDMVPFDRNGSAARSVKAALDLLRAGRSVLIFPEGTRSRNGQLQPFQRGIGHLALQAGVGVVPVYLSTHQALPVGSITLRERRVSARIGPFLSPADLAGLAKGQPGPEAERRVAAAVQDAVEALGNGLAAPGAGDAPPVSNGVGDGPPGAGGEGQGEGAVVVTAGAAIGRAPAYSYLRASIGS